MKEAKPTSAACMVCGQSINIDKDTLTISTAETEDEAEEFLGYACGCILDEIMRDDEGNILTERPWSDKEWRAAMMSGWIEEGLDSRQILSFKREIESHTTSSLHSLLGETWEQVGKANEKLVSTDQRREVANNMARFFIVGEELGQRGEGGMEWRDGEFVYDSTQTGLDGH
jgi:hypothetical protein